MSKLSELQQNVPDFKKIYYYFANKTLPGDEILQNKIIQTINYHEIRNRVLYRWFQRQVKCNQQHEDKWIQQLPLTFDLKPSKPTMTTVQKELIFESKKLWQL